LNATREEKEEIRISALQKRFQDIRHGILPTDLGKAALWNFLNSRKKASALYLRKIRDRIKV
jgi:hypothetical protein